MKIYKDFKDITPVVENQLCLSCGACDPICPTNVISFFETSGGHVFPRIDYDGCIECTLCLQVCPGIGFNDKMINNLPKDPFIGTMQQTLVGKSTNINRYKNSQSGGVATELIYWALKEKKIGAVIVAEMNDQINSSIRATGIVITDPENLIKTQKSKYVPIPLLSSIKEIERLNVDFAIVGVSCQLHGLIKLLAKKRKLEKHLKYKIGLICDRVMTYAGMDLLIDKSRINGKVKEFYFRDKSQGYPGNVKIKTEIETKYLNSEERIKIKDYFTPTRCRMCFDKMNIFSDITIGDPHGINNVDNKNGESLVIVRNQTGEELLQLSIKNHGLKLRTINDDVTVGQAIKYKKIEWHSYIKQYKEMNYLVPDYENAIYNTKQDEIINVKKQIAFSNRLFQAQDRNKLLASIKTTIRFRNLINYLKRIMK